MKARWETHLFKFLQYFEHIDSAMHISSAWQIAVETIWRMGNYEGHVFIHMFFLKLNALVNNIHSHVSLKHFHDKQFSDKNNEFWLLISELFLWVDLSTTMLQKAEQTALIC